MKSWRKINRAAHHWLFKMVFSLALLAFSAAGAMAGFVPILNPSFELPEVDTYTLGEIDGWVTTNPAFSGVQVPQSFYYISGVEGRQVGWIHDGTLSQVLTATIQANAVYTLKALVGNPYYEPTPNYALQLLDFDNNVLAQATGAANMGSLIEVATPQFFASSHPEYIDHTLKIMLSSTGPEVNFDRVTLEYSLVPLPAAAWLLGSGLIGLVGLKRLRKG